MPEPLLVAQAGTLQRIAQEFSRSGVPVFMADVKGDLAGLAQAAVMTAKPKQRLDLLGIEDFAAGTAGTLR